MNDEVLSLQFKNIRQMVEKLEPSADSYEGYIKNRVGFNFPAEFSINIPELKPHHKYVIGFIQNDKQTATHEMCHALYHCDEKYKKTWKKKWNNLNDNVRRKVEKKLAQMNYPNEVWIDEWQAYSQDGSKTFAR